MENILFLAHTEADGALSKVALESLTAAVELKQALNGTLSIALYGAQIQPAADSISACGAQRFFAVCGEDFEQARCATDAAACTALVRESGATMVIAAASSRNSRAMGAVAHRVHGFVDTHVTDITAASGALTVTRWFYRQRIEGSLTRAQRPWILLLDPGARSPWHGAPGSITPELVDVPLSESLRRTSVRGTITPPANQQTIRPDANLLFVAGAGWTKKQKDGQTHLPEAENIILSFLRNSKASLGGSKSLVDLSGENQAPLRFMSHLNQVGQTGATPRHPKGLSTCCHGEEPHTVGWRFIGERRAVNLDPNCGWARGKADVLYVADAFEVMSKVNALLSAM